MNCFKKALEESGLYVPDFIHIPALVEPDEVRILCAKLGLYYHTDCVLEMGEEPIIVTFQTRPNMSHAAFLESPALIAQKQCSSAIRFPLYNWVGVHQGKLVVLTETLFDKFCPVKDYSDTWAELGTFVLVRAYPNCAVEQYRATTP